MRLVEIGNGLYARTKGDGLSLLDRYLANQAKCTHAQRDPNGKCYKCGHENKKEKA